MERAASSGIAKAGPRRRQRAHRRCVREQLRSGAAVALRWLEAGGSEEHLRDGSTFTLPDRVEELFGSASCTSPLACKGDFRGRMRELMGSPLRDRLLRGVRGAAPACPSFQIAWRWRTRQRLSSCDRGSAVRPPRPGRVQALSTGECTEGLLCGQPTGMEEGGAPHGAVRVGAEPARKHSATSLCRGGLRGEEG